MARLPEPETRAEILKTCTYAAIRLGMQDLSLLKLSQSSKVSSRMLIYHFGSKEKLIEEILTKVQETLRDRLVEKLRLEPPKSMQQALVELWKHGTSKEMESYFKTFFALYSASLFSRKRYEDFIKNSVEGWIAWANVLGSSNGAQERDLTLILAVLRGLFLDYWATLDRKRTTLALHAFLEKYIG